MKRSLPITIALLTIFSTALFAASPRSLETNFKSPPASAKPHTWWHWMNDNVSRQGITADLEAMAQIGISGAQIFNVADKGSVNIPQGNVRFMSEQWLKMVKHAAEQADRLGIELCLHNCAGWSSSGGPWITPEYSMQEVVYKELKADGPAKFDKMLPQPTARKDFYRDIAILAFPTPANDEFRIDDISTKIGVRRQYSLDPNLAEVPTEACIAKDSIIDLTSKLDSDGRLHWQVPAGSWTILRIGHTTTGKTNHPAISGLGLECDKLSREAFDIHWDNAVKPVLDKLGKLAPKVLNNILVDSYEVRHNNWTKKMPREFKKRKGYDLIKYLPAFAGRVVENAQITERFLWDFRHVNSALFDENYFGYFADKCHKYGLLASVEPYGGPFEYLAVGGKCDVIMGEYWISSGDTVGLGGSLKIAATTAHTHGKTYVGAESFTSQPHKGRWQNHPASMKVLGDQVYCTGINRFIFHRYAHQPWIDVYPGMTMGQWGTHFDRTNTWWKQGKPWMTYLGRSQYMLQQGKFVGDVVFFMGESVPSSIVADEELKEAGYDYDLIGTDLIWKVKVKNRLITLPSGMQYKMLVLAHSDFMTAKLAERIKKLVKDGAKIVGSKPVSSPTLVGYPKSQEKLSVITDQLWGTDNNKKKIDRTYGKGKIFAGISTLQALKKLRIEPDFIDMSKKKETDFIHRRTKDADIYFVSSRNKKQNTKEFSFRINGKVPELWDAETGDIKQAPMWQEKDGRTVVTVDFAPRGSMFVVFREKTDKNSSTYTSIKSKIAPKPVKKSTDTLEILKAEYGVFTNTRKNMVDVTDKLTAMVKDNKLTVQASNNIAGDPLAGQVKNLYVTYSYGTKEYAAKAKEGKTMVLPKADIAADDKELKIIAAIYGRLPGGQTEARPPTVIDITDRVAAEVKDASISVAVDNALAGKDPVQRARKHLKVSYVFNGVKNTMVLDEGNWLQIPRDKFEPTAIIPEICKADGKEYLKVAENGQYGLKTAAGQIKTVNVSNLPESVKIDGHWKLTFTPGWGAPENISLLKLISWTDHEDDGVKYYSGTATYYKNFAIPDNFVGKNRRIVLDLGEVKYFAEVKVNGKSYDVLWKEPFHVDITDAVKVGKNKLEIAITNLWPNRLIGDEQYPDDCQWTGSALKCWPEWFVKKQPRPTKRLTFATWKHWKKDDKLLRSGLLGPVKLEAVKVIDLED